MHCSSLPLPLMQLAGHIAPAACRSSRGAMETVTIAAAWPSGRSTLLEPALVGWPYVESHLGEVVVRGQHLPELEFFHNNKTRAVSEGKIFVAKPEEHTSGFLGAFDSNPFPPQTRTAFDLLPPFLSGLKSKTHSN